MSESIRVLNQAGNETITYAGAELARYLDLILGQAAKTRLQLGLMADLGLAAADKDYFLDDEIYIDVKAGQGIIAGKNPRSVLLAVYRFLGASGCVWFRPGQDGEYIPGKALAELNVKLHEEPSFRHRGIDFIGEKSQEDILDLIEWLPKIGYNSVFFEGLHPDEGKFYRFWYEHLDHPYKKAAGIPAAAYKSMYLEAVARIKQLGLIFHSAGHGFTCEPLGLHPDYVGEVDPAIARHFAKVKGKREIWRNAASTNLCYSDPATVHLMVDFMLDFAQNNPQIDFMHVWIADGINNNCECAGCKDHLVSDLYIKILNQLDARLTEKGLATRIVLISYTDLLWKPEKEKLAHPERFTLTHAPHFRTYRKSFKDADEIKGHPKFKRNHNEYPVLIEENIAYFNDWNEYFQGDSFLFEYPLWVPQYADPGLQKLARVIYDDISVLEKLGINGYISCQQTRSFFPTGFPMYILGQALWNDQVSYDKLAEEYFQAAFAEDWQQALGYLNDLSELFDPDLRQEKGPLTEADFARFSKIIALINSFKKVIADNTNKGSVSVQLSWQYLALHADITALYALIQENIALGRTEEVKALWEVLEKYIFSHEDELKRVFDRHTYLRFQKSRII